MTKSDDFRQLGLDLVAFAASPESFLGMPHALPPEASIQYVKHCWLTARWNITRVQHVHSLRSISFDWEPRKVTAPHPLQNALSAGFDDGQSVERIVLSHAVYRELVYEIIFIVQRGTIEQITFIARRTDNDEWRMLDTPPAEMELDNLLRRMPQAMTPSFSRTELASV